MKRTEKIRLAVADDAPFIREIVKQIITQSEDIELVGEAQTGQEAVELVRYLKPDIILMDMVMPVKNGIEATKEILVENPKSKIIAFSTVDQESMMIQAIEAGCCNFLKKPFEAEDLKNMIKKTFEGALPDE